MKFGINTPHSDNDLMTSVAQPLDNNQIAYQLDILIPQGLLAITQGLDDSIVCGQSDGATIRVDVLNTIQRSRH